MFVSCINQNLGLFPAAVPIVFFGALVELFATVCAGGDICGYRVGSALEWAILGKSTLCELGSNGSYFEGLR